MDIDEWLKHRENKQQDSTAQPQPSRECPPCPACETKTKYMHATPEQLFYDIVHDGIVIDEQKAKEGPCTVVEYGSGKLYWDKGVIGVLNKDQAKKYCNGNVEEKKISKKQGKLIDDFKIASTQCEIGNTNNGKKINSIEDRLSCMYGIVGDDL